MTLLPPPDGPAPFPPLLPPDDVPDEPPMAVGLVFEPSAPPPPAGPTTREAVQTFAVWALIVFGFQMLQSGGHPINPISLLSTRPVWGIIAGAVFMITVVAWRGWAAPVGLRLPTSLRSAALAGWVMAAFLGITLAVGLPPLRSTMLILLNTACVGVSEELMFRGVILSAARRHLSTRPAVLLTSFVFGLVHVANVLATGQLLLAIGQAVLAVIFGVWVGVIRVKSESVLPGMAFHWGWDGLLLLSGGISGLAAFPAALILGIWGLRQLRTGVSD
jgi:membrane protease YdiL (CAAX protease family)